MAKRKIEITKAILLQVKERKKTENNNKIYRRLLFLEMKSSGMLHKNISSYLDVRIETLSVWTNIFLKKGLNALCNLQYEGRRISPLEKIKEEIKEHVKKENVPTLKELKKWIETKYGLSFGIAWIQRFCKKNFIFLIKKPD